MYSAPEQFDKELDKKHIDFQTVTTTLAAFNERVFANLISHGYKNVDLRSKSAVERLKLLKNRLCIKRGYNRFATCWRWRKSNQNMAV